MYNLNYQLLILLTLCGITSINSRYILSIYNMPQNLNVNPYIYIYIKYNYSYMNRSIVNVFKDANDNPN